MKKLIAIIVATLAIDIVSKQLILNLLSPHQSIPIIKGFFALTLEKNTGVAFSLLDGHLPLIIIMTSIIIIIIVKYLKVINPNNYEVICYGLIIGGAIGNLLDRLYYNYVIDFFDFNIFGYSFPVFNLADTAIVIGVFTLLILSFIESRNQNGTNRPRKIKNR